VTAPLPLWRAILRIWTEWFALHKDYSSANSDMEVGAHDPLVVCAEATRRRASTVREMIPNLLCFLPFHPREGVHQTPFSFVQAQAEGRGHAQGFGGRRKQRGLYEKFPKSYLIVRETKLIRKLTCCVILSSRCFFETLTHSFVSSVSSERS
jgi:hypothetical protein